MRPVPTDCLLVAVRYGQTPTPRSLTSGEQWVLRS